MRDNMIINISGLSGHFMAVDLNIEHIIGYLKVNTVALLMRRIMRIMRVDATVFPDIFLFLKVSAQRGTVSVTSQELLFSYRMSRSKSHRPSVRHTKE